MTDPIPPAPATPEPPAAEPEAPDAATTAPDRVAAPGRGRALPPDPGKYDAVRNVHARARGLDQPYIAGGEDPELGETLRQERRYVRLLVAMAVIIVAMGFVLGIVGAVISAVGVH